MTSELVGFGHLQIFIKTALWGHVVWWVLRPICWRVCIQVWLHGGIKIRRHRYPPTWGIAWAKELGWHYGQDDQWHLIECVRRCDRHRGHGDWCWLSLWHWG